VKIKDEGYTITGISGQEYIEIRPSQDAGEVVIETKDEAASVARSWGLDALQEYVDALNRAIQLGRNMEAQNVDRQVRP
jgi:hypothetical protein